MGVLSRSLSVPLIPLECRTLPCHGHKRCAVTIFLRHGSRERRSAFSTYNSVQKVAIRRSLLQRIGLLSHSLSVARSYFADFARSGVFCRIGLEGLSMGVLSPSLFGRLILLNRDQEVAPTGPTLAVPPGISKAGARCAPYRVAIRRSLLQRIGFLSPSIFSRLIAPYRFGGMR